MMITTVTTIGFKVPDEYAEMEVFCRTNDMSQWGTFATTQMICFTKADNVLTNIKKGEEHDGESDLPA